MLTCIDSRLLGENCGAFVAEGWNQGAASIARNNVGNLVYCLGQVVSFNFYVSVG